MSLGEHEVRAKLDEKDHREFHAFCMANGEDMATRLRILVREFNAAEFHKFTVLQRLLRSEGNAGDAKGRGEG